MKKIYVCQANGTEVKPYEKLILLFLALSFLVLMILVFKGFTIIINGNNVIGVFLIIISLLKIYYYNSKIIPSQIQIDSFYKLFIYTGKRIQYSTKLENIHLFSITEDGIILHSNKQIKIPFSEFENIDLTSFAKYINQVIKTNVNFHTILNYDNQIKGFSYFEGNDIKELQSLTQGKILTKYWWWSHQFPIISITSIAIILSIIDLSLWFFIDYL